MVMRSPFRRLICFMFQSGASVAPTTLSASFGRQKSCSRLASNGFPGLVKSSEEDLLSILLLQKVTLQQLIPRASCRCLVPSYNDDDFVEKGNARFTTFLHAGSSRHTRSCEVCMWACIPLVLCTGCTPH